MNVKGIIAISGRPGLYKVIAQSKSSVIVESLMDGKRTPAYASEKISTLEDISIFTYEEDVRLTDVFQSMIEKYEGGEGINHKEANNTLASELESILPNYDKERVYPSDVKKIFQWYNLLHKADLLSAEPEGESKDGEAVEAKVVKEEPKKVTTPTKVNKATKPAGAKAVAAVKTGSSRGK
jgi:hypothetical protein